MSAACRFCGCTEDDACRLGGGDTCVLNVQTSVCSSIRCIIANQQAQRLDRKRAANERARLVTPILQRFIESRRRKREARQSRSRKQRRAA